MKRANKKRLLSGALTLILLAMSIGATYYFQQQQINTADLAHKSEIEGLNLELTEMTSLEKTSAVVFNKDLSAGHTITLGDLMTVGIDAAITPSTIVTDKAVVVGQKTKVNVGMYEYVTNSLLFTSNEIENDLREKEFGFISVPEKAVQGDFVDLRIKFPSGQDYIVLAKKPLTDLSRIYNEDNQLISEKVWMNLNEKEIVHMGSAVVDAYLNKAELYLIEYVDPLSQEAAIVNYPVNFPVIDMISDNPDLMSEAAIALQLKRREELEGALKTMFSEEKIDFIVPEITYSNDVIVDELETPLKSPPTTTTEETTNTSTPNFN